jgi:hypothetical protein
MRNDEGDGIAPTAKAARWRKISRHQTGWHTRWNHRQQARSGYAGAPHAALQHPDSAMRSLAASLGYAQMAHPDRWRIALWNASAAATVSMLGSRGRPLPSLMQHTQPLA